MRYIYRMRCPFCKKDDVKVIDTRLSDEGFAIRRRRQCNMCKRRFTTFERLLDIGFKVQKKGGLYEPFDPEKVRQGLKRACWKRPVTDEQIEETVNRVEQRVYGREEMVIESQELGEIVMEELMRLDQVAYVRFASVYREFADVNDFVGELQMMQQRRKK